MAAERADEIPDPLHEVALRQPDAVALVTPERAIRYAELERYVAATAQRIGELAGQGERVALYAGNSWEMVIILLAAFRKRRVACPISPRVPPEAVAPLLDQVRASMLLTDQPELFDAHARAQRVLSVQDAVREEGGGFSDPYVDHGQAATVVFTSGSTGRPKAALHTFGNHYFNALGSNENLPLAPRDRWLLALPLYHVGGLGIVFRCLLAGATIVLPEQGIQVGAAIRRYEITHVSLVATQLLRLLRQDAALDGLKAVLLGGSAIPQALLRQAVERRLPVFTTYGLTEMASQVTTTPPGASLAQLGTSGKILPYREIRIASDGEILVQGRTRFAGYVEGDRIDQPFDGEGWFATGDLGQVDADGFLQMTGRKDFRFISGGENIQPEAIEAVLCRLDGVSRAVVVPVPDAEYGHRPVAFIDGLIDPATLRQHLEQTLPRFMIPDRFYAWPTETPTRGIKADRMFLQHWAADRQKGKR